MTTKTKRKFRVGDVVREVGAPRKLGLVVHIMWRIEPPLIVVKWPPSQNGVAYIADDLIEVEDFGRPTTAR
jgi:hypothetical protein